MVFYAQGNHGSLFQEGGASVPPSHFIESFNDLPGAQNYILNTSCRIKCVWVFQIYISGHVIIFECSGIFDLILICISLSLALCPLSWWIHYSLLTFSRQINTLPSKQINQYFHIFLFLASITLKSIPSCPKSGFHANTALHGTCVPRGQINDIVAF